MTLYVIGVPLVAAAPLLWMAYGTNALLPFAVVAVVGLVFVHAVLLDWRRIPFTCSYLQGKRFIGHSALIGVAACVLFTLTYGASLLLIGYWLRERRLLNWTRTPLMFEDEFPDQTIQLQL